MFGSGILLFLFFPPFHLQFLASRLVKGAFSCSNCALWSHWKRRPVALAFHFVYYFPWSKGFPVSLQTVLSLMPASVSEPNTDWARHLATHSCHLEGWCFQHLTPPPPHRFYFKNIFSCLFWTWDQGGKVLSSLSVFLKSTSASRLVAMLSSGTSFTRRPKFFKGTVYFGHSGVTLLVVALLLLEYRHSFPGTVWWACPSSDMGQVLRLVGVLTPVACLLFESLRASGKQFLTMPRDKEMPSGLCFSSSGNRDRCSQSFLLGTNVKTQVSIFQIHTCARHCIIAMAVHPNAAPPGRRTSKLSWTDKLHHPC